MLHVYEEIMHVHIIIENYRYAFFSTSPLALKRAESYTALTLPLSLVTQPDPFPLRQRDLKGRSYLLILIDQIDSFVRR